METAEGEGNAHQMEQQVHIRLEGQSTDLLSLQVTPTMTLLQLRKKIGKCEEADVPSVFSFLAFDPEEDEAIQISRDIEDKCSIQAFLPIVTLRTTQKAVAVNRISRVYSISLDDIRLPNIINSKVMSPKSPEPNIQARVKALSQSAFKNRRRRSELVVSLSESPKQARSFWLQKEKDSKAGVMQRSDGRLDITWKSSNMRNLEKEFEAVTTPSIVSPAMFQKNETDTKSASSPSAQGKGVRKSISQEEISLEIPEPKALVHSDSFAKEVEKQISSIEKEEFANELTPVEEEIRSFSSGNLMALSREEVKLILDDFLKERPTVKELTERKILESTNSFPVSRSLTKISFVYNKSALVDPASGKEWRVEGGKTLKGRNDPELDFIEMYETFYHDNFLAKTHSHYGGTDEKVGPAIVSVLDNPENGALPMLIRTAKADERVYIDENMRGIGLKKMTHKAALRSLKTTHPHIFANMKLSRMKSSSLSQELLRYELSLVCKHSKIGVLCCKEGQTTDDEMFSNETGSEKFNEFLQFLGEEVSLKDWKQFAGGLDTKNNSTGKTSYFANFVGLEVMFHVSTLLPFNPNDEQQVERKRHLGNDVVVILFKEGTTPFNPSMIKSQFNHVFIIVSPVELTSGTQYKIAICSKRGVAPFGPVLPESALFRKNSSFRNFLLIKALNAERAAMFAPVFAQPIARTRRRLLENIIQGATVGNNSPGSVDIDSPRVKVRRSARFTVNVKHMKILISTTVNDDCKASDLLAKVKNRLPETVGKYALHINNVVVEPDTLLHTYLDGKRELTVEYKSLYSTTSGRRLSLGLRNIVEVKVKSEQLELTTRVDSESTMSKLLTSVALKFSHKTDGYRFFKDGVCLEGNRTVGELATSNKLVLEFESPLHHGNKTD